LEGDINTLSYRAEFSDEGEGLLEKEMILDFSVSKGTVKYISTMTPITNFEGVGRIENNALTYMMSQENSQTRPRLFKLGIIA